MTEKTNIRQANDKSFDNEDVKSVYDLMTESDFSVTDLKIFYKKNRKAFGKKEFWTSNLPLLHLNDILKTDLKNDFLDHYFKRNEFCNHQLNKALVSIRLSDFLLFFKMNKAFRHDDFMNSLERLSRLDSNLKVFYKEVFGIRKASANINKKLDEIREKLAENKLDNLLLGFALWHQNLKVSPSILDNKSNQTKYEMAAAEELNEVLKLYKNKKLENIAINSNSELQDRFNINKSPHPILDKTKKTNAKDEVLQNISDLIDESIKTTALNYTIDFYLCGYADIEFIDSEEIELKTNKYFTIFSLNDTKKGAEEMYFLPSINELLSKPKIMPHGFEINLNISSYYGVPKLYGVLDFHKIFKLLDYFSIFKSPLTNSDARIKKKQHTLLKFREYFGLNESITLFDYKELLNGIQDFFQWENSETEILLNFLTFDLSSKKHPKNWLSYPFIRIQSKVFWLGTFCVDRRWDNILINKIKIEEGFVELKQKAASNFEIRMEELFRGKGFKTNRGYSFINRDGESGEIDLLAYKDNCLFICEAKSSIRSDDFSHSVETQNRIFEGKAAHQLIKYETNIKEDWGKIKEKLCIDKGLKLEDVKIIPLIVTDHFEGDLALYLDKYQKVSFLELDVIMNNNRKKLLEGYLFHEKGNNAKSRNLNIEDILKKCDLWHGHDELKVEFIEQNIKDNSVWKGLEPLIDTSYRKLTIPMMD